MSDQERQAASSPTPGVFVRDATGLVKNVSLIDSIAINMSNMSIGAFLGVIGISGLLPMLFAGQNMGGVNLVYLSVIAFVVSFPQIAIYTIMTRRYPRTGGDYVWVSRTLGGPAGSVLSFMGYTIETTAYIGLIVLSTVFAIGSVGLFFTFNDTYLGLSLPSQISGSMPALQFGVGTLIIAVLIGINIVKPKWGFRLVSIFTIFGILALLIAIGELLGAGSSGVQAYINNPNGAFAINGTNTYSIVSSQYPGGTFNFTQTIFLLPLLAAFVYPWLNAAPAVASEIKGKSAVRWNVPISAVLIFIFLTASLAAMYYTAGQAFTNAAYSSTILGYGAPPAATSFNFWTLAMGVSGNNIVAGIIGLGWIVGNLTVLAYAVIVISRYLLAQSFDRFLPARISNVSPRFGSPILALVIVLVLVVALVGFAAFDYGAGLFGGASYLFGAILASMIYFIFVGLTAAIHALRNEHGMTKAILAVAGILNIFVFGFLSWQFVANPTVWSLNNFTYTFIIGSAVVAAIIYYASRAYYKRRGIDIGMAYKQIPPE